MNRPHSNPQPSRRHGFTLVEILVVITVIAILVALLVPSLMSAFRNVRVAQVRTDISQLEAGITQFKQRFGSDPPSVIVLCEAAANWSTYPESRSFIREFWPQYDFGTHDINNDGDSIDVITLTGGECLVFFLGGILSDSPSTAITRRAPTGFSKNPLNPFVSGGSREGPFFEFKTNRFVDTDADGVPEYCDPLPGQTMPYLYYSSYDGAGYRQTGASAEFAVGTYLRSPYRQGASGTSQPFKPKGYQIISPGSDKAFGAGGPFLPSEKVRLPAYTIDLNGDGDTSDSGESVTLSERNDERDNITNFHDGLLNP